MSRKTARDRAFKLVFEYIETFYNTIRIHSHCGYLSPNEYENKYYSEKIKNACLLQKIIRI